MRYSRGASNYLKRIILSYLIHIMTIANTVAIGVETVQIDSRCSLEKEFTKLICMNP